jgi:hypothetical protein
MKVCIAFLFVLLATVTTNGQKQLVLLKGERVVVRFTQGEYFYCKLKNKQVREGKLINLTDTQIITSTDTLNLLSIESIKVKGRHVSRVGKLGRLFMIAGIGYFSIDQLNNLILRGETELEKDVIVPSLILTGVGAGMVYIRSPYKKVYGHTLKTIDYTSRFYKL